MRVSGVLFDLDGTLYRHAPVRAAMACELACAWPRYGTGTPALWRVLRAFRRGREELRLLGRPDEPLEQLQYSRAAEQAGVPSDTVRTIVEEWIFRRPLRHLPRARRAHAVDALQALRSRGIAVGVFSDYPTRTKLNALGLSHLVGLELCATDPDVNAFKPHPQGFLHACERWGIPPGEVVYVGDRVSVDGRGASAAGMRAVIIGAERRRADGPTSTGIGSFASLEVALTRLSGATAQECGDAALGKC